jgi:hypothetical protein
MGGHWMEGHWMVGQASDQHDDVIQMRVWQAGPEINGS